MAKDDFSHFAKHKFSKKSYVATPLLTSNCLYKTLMLNKKQNLKSWKKDKEMGIWKKKEERKPPKEKGLMKNNFVI